MNDLRPLLFIPDLQIPFEHARALKFTSYLKSHYKIPDENCYCVGDETDQYWGSQWKKDINARHTALSEISETIEKMRVWYDIFPQMKIATSNHGTRWMRKALEAEIPSQLIRRYEKVIGAPKGWIWQKRWLIRTKRPILMEHGDRFGGMYPHAAAAAINACNTVIGHFHSIAGIEHIKTLGAQDGCDDEAGFEVWGMCVGSLINFEEYAFHYARASKRNPQLGAGIVLNKGTTPLWIPME